MSATNSTRMILLLCIICTLLGNILADTYACHGLAEEPQYLNCQNMNLTAIPEYTSPDITKLDLSHNALTESTLSKVHNGTEFLDISYNRVTIIRSTTLQDVWNVHTLDISNNIIRTIQDRSFSTLQALVNLDISGNFVKTITNATFGQLGSLKSLNLSGNWISNIESCVFAGMPSLIELDLSHNWIRVISNQLFTGLASLQTLHLQDNDIKYLEMGWTKNLTNLSYLDLSGNVISSMNPHAEKLPNLQILNISYNDIRNFTSSTLPEMRRLTTLILDGNPIHVILDGAFTNLKMLQVLSISNMYELSLISHNAFHGLESLVVLTMSGNKKLSFIYPDVLQPLKSLEAIDLTYSNISRIIEGTLPHNGSIEISLAGSPLECGCHVHWLVTMPTCDGENAPIMMHKSNWNADVLHSIQGDHINPHTRHDTVTQPKTSTEQYTELASTNCLKDYIVLTCSANGTLYEFGDVPLSDIQCTAPYVISNETQKSYNVIGSSAIIPCDVSGDLSSITWLTPSGYELTYYNLHVEELYPSINDVQPHQPYHKDHPWHNLTTYFSSFGDTKRVILLKDGSLYIDYVIRPDAGIYTCIAKNSLGNNTVTMIFYLDFDSLYRTKVISFGIGFGCAGGFFLLNVTIFIICWLVKKCINQRKRQKLKQIIVNIDAYKTVQIGKIKDIGAAHMERFREQYHNQMDRLRDNYNQHVFKVKDNCTQQMDKLRESYVHQTSRIKDYSALHIDKIRDNYSVQILRVREYGSSQMDRLRESYKLQQQHILKILETMNLESCRTVIESECMKAESTLFDTTDLFQDSNISCDTNSNSSDYITASSNNESPLHTPDATLAGNNQAKLPDNLVPDDLSPFIPDNDLPYPYNIPAAMFNANAKMYPKK